MKRLHINMHQIYASSDNIHRIYIPLHEKIVYEYAFPCMKCDILIYIIYMLKLKYQQGKWIIKQFIYRMGIISAHYLKLKGLNPSQVD